MEFELNQPNIRPAALTEEVHDIDGIPILDNVSYNEFFEKYLIMNRPCVIKGMTLEWESSNYWVDKNLNAPNFDYLVQKYGFCEVPVYNCDEKYYNSQQKETLKFKDYVSYWERCINGEKLPMKYLKDWHLKNAFPCDNFYDVPLIFESDWLNEYLVENEKDDYRFVYMGPKGTWTPFHSDVFTSFSWSANICGKKKWIFFPPGEEEYLKDKFGNLPYDINKISHTRKCFEVIQNPSEIVFVPSGWHHQVWNLEHTISINHNWVNGCNINTMWTSILYNLECVKKEIADCADMDNFTQHCQVVLKASYGMDFRDFYEFVEYIALKRIDILNHRKNQMFHNKILGKNHALFDLRMLHYVLKMMQNETDLAQVLENCNVRLTNLLNQIARVLDEKCY